MNSWVVFLGGEVALPWTWRSLTSVIGPICPPPGEDSPMSTLLLSVMGAFAEFERALIRERQREGIAIAKAQVSRPEGEALP